jgi:hypothetical protein
LLKRVDAGVAERVSRGSNGKREDNAEVRMALSVAEERKRFHPRGQIERRGIRMVELVGEGLTP